MRSEGAARELARISAASFEEPWTEEVFRRELERPECRVRLEGDPSQASRLVGYALGWRVLDELQVLSVAVEPRARGRGVGRRMLAGWLDELRAEGVRHVTLEVRESNGPARTLYRRLGLAEVGARPRYYPGGEGAVLLTGAL